MTTGREREGAQITRRGHLRSAKKKLLPIEPSMWLLLACTKDPAPDPEPATQAGPNVLVILLDDVGTDKIAGYGEHPTPPSTPSLDALIERGVLFRNAWAYPNCTPTRAAIQTGRYGRRTGIGGLIDPNLSEDEELSLEETTIPEMLTLAEASWSTSLVGKWHLSTYTSPSGVEHPGLQGFSWYAATMGNLTNRDDLEHPAGYYEWQEIVNGTTSWRTDYATTAQTDRALQRMAEMRPPWLLYLSYNAPHSPYDPPPAELVSSDPAEMQDEASLYDGTLEALDTEIGRLMRGVDLSTTFVVALGDNGTPEHAILPPRNPAFGKDTLYEGGINVPLIVAGPGISAGESQALVHAVDVFATVADIAGVDVSALPREIDGESLLPYALDPELPGREIVYTERFVFNGQAPYWNDQRSARDARYKLAVREAGEPGDAGDIEWLFDLQGSDVDGPDLYAQGPLTQEAQAARDKLAAAIAAAIARTD